MTYRGRSYWWYLALLPLGIGAWAPIYAGLKARQPVWTAIGVVWTVIAIVGYALTALHSHHGGDRLAGDLLLISWFGGAVSSFLLRVPYDRAVAPAAEPSDPD